MWARLRRPMLSVLLLAGGIAMLIYGARFHHTPVVDQVVAQVVEEQEIEETITIPHPFEPPPDSGLPPPPPILQKVVRTVEITKDVLKDVINSESEPALIREATVGGVTLLASGRVKRTYGPTLDGEAPSEPPSLCPT